MTTTPSPERIDRWSRWSDRLNPILVREVVQAVRGRAFPLMVLGTLAIGVIIAIAVVRDGEADQASGRTAFSAGLATLVPLLLFVVPMQAYQSMRHELGRGIVEQLFLSRLRPRAIVAGKLLAAMVQFVLYVSVIAPLLATSYLLRGVDLPTIALSLAFAFVFNLAATAAAISAAAQAIVPAMQAIANVAVAFGLGLLTFFLTILIFSGEYLREVGQLMRSPEFGPVTSLVVLGALAGTTLSGLTAQSFLLHAFENRSTGFRVFLFATIAAAFGWLLVFVDPSSWREFAYGLLTFLTLLGGVFGIFMATEQRDLSPRVRTHVPRNAILAAIQAPLLPGRDRGVLCVLVYLAVLGAILAAIRAWSPSASLGRFMTRIADLPMWIGGYVLLWISIGKLLRGRLPATVQGNHGARFLMPLLFLLALLGPVLFDVLVHGRVDDWHVGHVLNPFWTIDQFVFRSRSGSANAALAFTTAALVVMHAPAAVRGLREVLAASAARRARSSTAAAAAAAAEVERGG